jgi:hypothetical protein
MQGVTDQTVPAIAVVENAVPLHFKLAEQDVTINQFSYR